MDTQPPGNAPQPDKFWVVVPCAGSGSRAGGDRPKQYQTLQGRPLVAHTLAALAAVRDLELIVVALAPGDADYDRLDLPSQDRVQPVRCGGQTRAQTVANALQWLAEHGATPDDWVLVHDAARCLVTPAQVNDLIEACRAHQVGGLLAQPVADTLKQSSAAQPSSVACTVSREHKWLAQTPQMFRLGLLRQALQHAQDAVTDEASAIEALGYQPLLVVSRGANFKVTYPDDFALAQAMLAQRDHATQEARHMTLRMGQGWDTHALVAGRDLILAGVKIPHTVGLLGHSDADVLTHAIIDALLGAAGLGDIGRHFPDTDERYRGADSIAMLLHTAQLLRAEGFEIQNVDSTVVAQSPRLAPHIEAMRRRLAETLGLPVARVNVKAKTAERMGPVGEGRAMEAQAVALLCART